MPKVGFFYLIFIPVTGYFGQMFSDMLGHTNQVAFAIKIVTMLLNFVGEFLWWKFVVFRGSENTNALAKKDESAK